MIETPTLIKFSEPLIAPGDPIDGKNNYDGERCSNICTGACDQCHINVPSDEPEWTQKKWEWFLATRVCPEISEIGDAVENFMNQQSSYPYLLMTHTAHCSSCLEEAAQIIDEILHAAAIEQELSEKI